MKIIWTPWRMKYILGEKGQGCILCDKHRAPETADAENMVLHRGASCYILLNLFPYSNGHIMVAPYEHLESPELLDNETMAELMQLTSLSVAALRKDMSPAGFNVGMNIGRVAGAGIADHVHMHVVPRWYGDTNYMSVLAETRLIPETLRDTYKRLKAALAEVGPHP